MLKNGKNRTVLKDMGYNNKKKVWSLGNKRKIGQNKYLTI